MLVDHRHDIVRFLRARAPGDDAEDLVQELWLRAQAGGSGPIADPLAYLYRMANNLVLDRHRASKRRMQRDQGWAESRSGGEWELPAAAERVLMARDQLRAIDALLADLGERTDWIFRRFRIEGATQEQIARDLGISISAVEKHLQKAYRALIRARERFDVD